MPIHFVGLWRHPDFLKLWVGQAVSLFGSLVGRFALPLVAVVALDASPGQVALLYVAEMAPAILIGLFAGAWVDRLRRRPIMLWADVGRALLLLSIPAAAVAGLLRVEQLYVVVVLVGTLTTFFDVAYRSYLPTLVPRAALVEANSKLQASSAVVEVTAFGAAGVLVQLLTAPVAILVDAGSFLISALSLALIRAPDSRPRVSVGQQPTWLELRAGLHFVLGEPVLRALGAVRATRNVFLFIWVSMLMVLLTRELRLEPAPIGVLFALGGISSLVGALWAERIVRRWGLGPTMVLGLTLSSASLLCVPLASGPLPLILALVGAQQLFDAPATVYEIHETSLIQASAPDHLLGRVTASLRCVEWAAMLAGALLGGLLGEVIGPRATMFVGALGTLPTVLWLIASPVRQLRAMPEGR